MKPYTPLSSIGRSKGGHDIHHKTADIPHEWRHATAKKAKHAARQAAQEEIVKETLDFDTKIEILET